LKTLDPEPDSLLVRVILRTKYIRFFGRRVIPTYRCTLPEGMSFRFRSLDGSEVSTIREVLHQHVYERFPLPLDGVVADIGANVGLFSVRASRLVGEHGVVIAVEPDPVNFRLLRENVALNACTNVRLVKAALGDKNTRVSLNVYRSRVFNSFLAQSKKAEGVVTVDMRTMDTLSEEIGLRRLDLLKLDTEGYELPVLKGATRVIEKFSPFIVGESHPYLSDSGAQIARFLSSLGYRTSVEPTRGKTELFFASPLSNTM